MNFMKRALTSVQRRLGKSAILLILIFILGNIIIGAVAVRQAVANTEKGIRKNLGAVASIQMDSDALQKEFENNPEFDPNKMELLSADLIEKVGKMPAVKYYDYNSYAAVEMNEYKRYTTLDIEEIGGNGASYFSMLGVQYAKVLSIVNGDAKLVEGRVFTEEEINDGTSVIMVSKKFAELNNLEVGSKMVLKMPVRNYASVEENPQVLAEITKDVEIIGIYEPKIEASSEQKQGEEATSQFIDEEKENMFYAPNKFIATFNSEYNSEYNRIFPQEQIQSLGSEIYTPIYVLNDPLDLEDFKEEVLVMIPEFYTVIDSGSTYESVAGPVNSIQNIATWMLYIAIIATIVILGLVVTLFLRDRKHEIGIYLALGEKRNKIISQIVIEVISIALIAITLSVFSGTVLAKNVSQSILEDQLISQEESSDWMINGGGSMGVIGLSTEVSSEDILAEYNVSLDAKVIVLFYVIGLGTVLGSTIVPMVYISRLNPKKVMM